jgi:hypothetical protein
METFDPSEIDMLINKANDKFKQKGIHTNLKTQATLTDFVMCLKESSNIEQTSASGVKFDENKPDMTDIPKEAMWAMGAAFSHGQKKYGKNNYRKGMKASRQLAAAVRHIYQHLDGETLDPESGIMHLGHALASIAMACYTIKNHPQLDDRHPEDIKKYET